MPFARRHLARDHFQRGTLHRPAKRNSPSDRPQAVEMPSAATSLPEWDRDHFIDAVAEQIAAILGPHPGLGART
jgi:hypothetical protein